ncbi:MAG: hypothetical protein Q7R53_01830 [bacterium]|nr:hypothetical protein [bacterium]
MTDKPLQGGVFCKKFNMCLKELAGVNQDVPEHQNGLTSSIGGLWPPEIASFDRVKGIYTPGIINTNYDLQDLVCELIDQASTHFSNHQEGATRISLRAVVGVDQLKATDDAIIPFIEAVVPLSGTQAAFENSALVYFGLNHSRRQSLPEEIELCRRNLQEAMRLERRSPAKSLERARSNGYDISILPKNISPETVDQMTELYSRFGWQRHDVAEILSNPNSIIAIAHNGQVISAGIAELGQISIGENTLRVAEITEAATVTDHMGLGLYTAISNLLISEIARRSKLGGILGGEVDFVYGECNGNAPGVLKTACIQGRTFSTSVGDEFGFPESGILHQHVPISGSQRKTPYNDLLPAFITKDDLYRFF